MAPMTNRVKVSNFFRTYPLRLATLLLRSSSYKAWKVLARMGGGGLARAELGNLGQTEGQVLPIKPPRQRLKSIK